MVYKHSYVSSISKLAEVVLTSTTKSINIPQLISETRSENSLVPIRTWKVFLGACFRKIPNLTKYHHFRLSSSEPGKVVIREFPSSAEFSVTIIKDQEKLQSTLTTDPEIIRPPGLSAERAWYLYENVRQHCDGDVHKDSTCPKLSVPKPRSMKAQKVKEESGDL